MPRTYKKSNKKSIYHIQRRLYSALVVLLVLGVVGGRFAVGLLVSEEANQDTGQSAAPNSSQIAPRSGSDELTLEQPLDIVAVDVSKELTRIAEEFQEETGASVAISVQSLNGAFSAQVNESEKFAAASLYKTLAAYVVLQRVDRDELALDMKTDTSDTIGECIVQAITVSDNPCGVALQSLAQPYSADNLMRGWGYEQTTLSGYYPETSAQDQAQLLEDIFRGERLSDSSREFLLQQLANQKITNRLPDLEGVDVYAKTGDIDGSVHSVALINGGGATYTAVILTDKWSASILSKYSAIADIHSAMHEVITNESR